MLYNVHIHIEISKIMGSLKKSWIILFKTLNFMTFHGSMMVKFFVVFSYWFESERVEIVLDGIR